MPYDIEVKWLKGSAKNWTDVLPVKTFAISISGFEGTHLVRSPRSQSRAQDARFRLSVDGSSATLDYSVFRDYNKRRGMEPGVMRLLFSNAKRTQVKELSWDGERVGPATAVFKTVLRYKAATTGALVTAALRKYAERMLRPGQTAFREQLDIVYGSKCCVTSCPIQWALEGAHLIPFSISHSDKTTNGILLRRDLHSLFDAGQIAIEPKTRRIYLSPELRNTEYEPWHGRELLAPQPGYKSDAPSISALSFRWKRFTKRGWHRVKLTNSELSPSKLNAGSAGR